MVLLTDTPVSGVRVYTFLVSRPEKAKDSPVSADGVECHNYSEWAFPPGTPFRSRQEICNLAHACPSCSFCGFYERCCLLGECSCGTTGRPGCHWIWEGLCLRVAVPFWDRIIADIVCRRKQPYSLLSSWQEEAYSVCTSTRLVVPLASLAWLMTSPRQFPMLLSIWSSLIVTYNGYRVLGSVSVNLHSPYFRENRQTYREVECPIL